MSGGKIATATKERVFGNEKNKLVIQPTGVQTVEFLLQYFEKMFSYDYTKNMEEELDEITNGSEWAQICKECYNEIKELSKPVNALTKQTFKIDDNHIFMFAMHGPVIKKLNQHVDDNGGGDDDIDDRDGDDDDDETAPAVARKPTYMTVKKNIDIDIEKLKRGEYTLADLAEIQNDCLGKYENQNVYIKTGRFGPYIEIGDTKISIKTIKKPLSEITLDDVMPLLGGGMDATTSDTPRQFVPPPNAKILRLLSPTMNIRTGKFGPYVYYKREDMTKPQFLNIKKFKEGFFDCDALVLVEWLRKTYHLPIE